MPNTESNNCSRRFSPYPFHYSSQEPFRCAPSQRLSDGVKPKLNRREADPKPPQLDPNPKPLLHLGLATSRKANCNEKQVTPKFPLSLTVNDRRELSKNVDMTTVFGQKLLGRTPGALTNSCEAWKITNERISSYSLSNKEFKDDVLKKNKPVINIVSSSSWLSGRKVKLPKDKERYLKEQEVKDEKKKEDDKIRREKKKEDDRLTQLCYKMMDQAPRKLPLAKVYPELKPSSSRVNLGGKLNTMKCKDCDQLIVPFCKFNHSCI